ncbi:hypothetical protein BD560DRAFT_494631 [Blakeslea trispora]|nr:hypothetical protein BD560DRAFT_494631 [Blakeslea trispora]
MNRQIPQVAASTPRTPARTPARALTRPAALPVPVAQPDGRIDDLLERIAFLESAFGRSGTSSANGDATRRPLSGRNPVLLKAVKNALETAKRIGVEFALDHSLKKSGRNQPVFRAILQNAITEMKAVAGYSEHDELSKEVIKCLEEKIRNQFNVSRANEKRGVSSLASREQTSLKERKRKRVDRKLMARRACFAKDSVSLSRDIGSIEECNAVLERAYISDEEDEADGEFGELFRVLVPSWRSDKLNSFFSRLDDADRRSKKKHVRATRRRRNVEAALSEELRRPLPRWALNE